MRNQTKQQTDQKYQFSLDSESANGLIGVKVPLRVWRVSQVPKTFLSSAERNRWRTKNNRVSDVSDKVQGGYNMETRLLHALNLLISPAQRNSRKLNSDWRKGDGLDNWSKSNINK